MNGFVCLKTITKNIPSLLEKKKKKKKTTIFFKLNKQPFGITVDEEEVIENGFWKLLINQNLN